ncbi:hypothetical protein [Streptomyces sp. NBC_00299]|uniref:hypothetical protein n=1 Tax=Streptomyces sp. NBC_00299 TaxID=2975705 RepID=UPI002E2DA197|nr:hypothetical protein [Streptomyces sp. NBC_00299]
MAKSGGFAVDSTRTSSRSRLVSSAHHDVGHLRQHGAHGFPVEGVPYGISRVVKGR